MFAGLGLADPAASAACRLPTIPTAAPLFARIPRHASSTPAPGLMRIQSVQCRRPVQYLQVVPGVRGAEPALAVRRAPVLLSSSGHYRYSGASTQPQYLHYCCTCTAVQCKYMRRLGTNCGPLKANSCNLLPWLICTTIRQRQGPGRHAATTFSALRGTRVHFLVASMFALYICMQLIQHPPCLPLTW